MWQAVILLILITNFAVPLGAQSPVLLHTAVGFGVLKRGDFDRRTDVLILEGSVSAPAGPATVGAGALWGVYESVHPLRPSQLSHWSFFIEGRRRLSLGGSPYVAHLAGRLGYDIQHDGDLKGDGVMYGGSIALGRRLNRAVVLGISGVATRYSLGSPIGDGRLYALRLEAQINP